MITSQTDTCINRIRSVVLIQGGGGGGGALITKSLKKCGAYSRTVLIRRFMVFKVILALNQAQRLSKAI